MRTQMLGKVDIDRSRLHDDIEVSRGFSFAEQYPEFQSGQPWKTCMLWSCGGVVGDGIIAHYDTSQPARPTVFGEQLPYVCELLESSVAVEHLLFARMVIMTNAVLLPHRDYVEFTEKPDEERPGHRLHIPLVTDETCLFMEDETIYRMFFGEFWSLDVTRMHSAAVLSDTRRIHLIMDFADMPESDVLRVDRSVTYGIPEANVVRRPPLSDRERDAILALSAVVDAENLNEVFGIVIRKSYRRDGGERFAWDAMRRIAKDSGDPGLATTIDELYTLCMLERDE
jgi:hypothetical protein